MIRLQTWHQRLPNIYLSLWSADSLASFVLDC